MFRGLLAGVHASQRAHRLYMLIYAAAVVTCEQEAGDTWGPAAQTGVRKGVLVVTGAAEMRQMLSKMYGRGGNVEVLVSC